MLRVFSQKAALVARSSIVVTPLRVNVPAGVAPWSRQMSAKVETDEEFDNRYVAYFNKPDIDGWEVRKGMNDLMGYDLVPEPKIIVAALKACRRLNDYSLTTRFLESIKFKCQVNPEIYPYVMKEIKPTLDELGISSVEELGYDKPELALQSVFDIHG